TKYPPGQSLVLTPGELLGLPWLTEPCLAAALILATYYWVREAFGERQALLAAALLAASPFVWCTAGTRMPFAPTACFLVCALAFAARAERSGGSWAYAACGAALGMAGLIRPYDALLFALPMGTWLGLAAVRARNPRILGVVLGLAPAACVLLWFNLRTMGTPFRMGYWHAKDFSIGFFTHPLPGFDYIHTPFQAIGNLSVAVLRLDTWLLAWPCSLLLVAAGLALGPKTIWDRRICVLLAVFTLGYSAIASSGTWDVGPTYYFVLAPLLIALAVRGTRALRSLPPEGSALRRFFGLLPLVGLAVGAITLVPLHLIRLGALTAQIEAPWRAIAQADPGDCIVILPSAVKLHAAGYSLGYPYEVRTRHGVAHLIRPVTTSEASEARQYLGSALPLYALNIDAQRWSQGRERRYTLQPLQSPGSELP
ncbi:MAG TPA: glycosyltransferase family 39 protein, partial [Polyangiaceae bacterium]|nr:glycosyltransferase family 39 protein [Polyangiaceae bacterium]